MSANIVENKTEDFNHTLALLKQLLQSFGDSGVHFLMDTTLSDSWLTTIKPEFLYRIDSNTPSEENYSFDFNRSQIQNTINGKLRPSKYIRNRDVKTMIMFGLKHGNDLNAMEYDELKPINLPRLIQLIRIYNLESYAFEDKTALTFTRICLSYPIRTCLYLYKNKINGPHHPVTLELMESISKNYPSVMMTFAFPFLIPNTNNTFCSLLKKAHMLYQFVYFITVVNPCIERIIDRIISHVNTYTQSLINEEDLTYDLQIKYLQKLHLLANNDEQITVVETVVEAAKIWDQILEKASHFLN